MLRPKPKRRLLLKKWRLIKKRRCIRCSSLKMKIFYTKMYFVKRQTGKRWKLKRKKQRRPVNITELTSSKPSPTRWYKIYEKKEMMAIKKSKILGLPEVPTKERECCCKNQVPFAPRKKMKKNTPLQLLIVGPPI